MNFLKTKWITFSAIYETDSDDYPDEEPKQKLIKKPRSASLKWTVADTETLLKYFSSYMGEHGKVCPSEYNKNDF